MNTHARTHAHSHPCTHNWTLSTHHLEAHSASASACLRAHIHAPTLGAQGNKAPCGENLASARGSHPWWLRGTALGPAHSLSLYNIINISPIYIILYIYITGSCGRVQHWAPTHAHDRVVALLLRHPKRRQACGGQQVTVESIVPAVKAAVQRRPERPIQTERSSRSCRLSKPPKDMQMQRPCTVAHSDSTGRRSTGIGLKWSTSNCRADRAGGQGSNALAAWIAHGAAPPTTQASPARTRSLKEPVVPKSSSAWVLTQRGCWQQRGRWALRGGHIRAPGCSWPWASWLRRAVGLGP
jgi:hypothetical protein